jgi:cadmium resistance protein CadD (predicted permease)
VGRLLDVCGTAVGAFVGTNVDDFVVLLLLILGIPAGGHRRWQIVAGQYLGFSALVVISLLGAAALRSVSENLVGLLGIIPLALGIRGLARIVRGRSAPQDEPILAGNLATVAIVTVANGGDNVSVYVLLFRGLKVAEIAMSIGIFLVMLGFLCAVALVIGERAKLVLGAMGNTQWLTSIVFTMIGIVVLVRTGAVAHIADLIARAG